MKPILITGIPRSGTTWVGRTLARTDGAYLLNEPDNHAMEPYAQRAKQRLGRYPVLGAGDPAPAAYHRLWERALVGKSSMSLAARASRSLRLRAGRGLLSTLTISEMRSAFPAWHPQLPLRLKVAGALGVPRARPSWATRTVVKSVFAPLAIEWIDELWSPHVVIVLRHPLNVISSWSELGYPPCGLDQHPTVMDRYLRHWGVAPCRPSASPLERIAWEVGVLMCALEGAADSHPEWTVAVHEDLCSDPVARFRRLSERIGLDWTESAEGFLRQSNRPGRGYETNRMAGEQPQLWRTRLTPGQIQLIGEVLRSFPLRRWSTEDTYAG
jgi:hypothetical protein